jgi:hypothetical protein
MRTGNAGQHHHRLVYRNRSPAVSPIAPFDVPKNYFGDLSALPQPDYLFGRLFSRIKTAKNAGGLRETLCPEMAFASVGGSPLAG